MRVIPSDVVREIDEHFPWANNPRPQGNLRNATRLNAPPVLSGILVLIRNIPEELLVLNSQERARFTIAVAMLEARTSSGLNNPNDFGFPMIGDNFDCLPFIRETLEKCPDEAPSKCATGLLFISDLRFRDALLTDLGSAERALNNSEWKAATVLGGSIIEALLLWAIQLHDVASRSAAAAKASPESGLKALSVDDITGREWSLARYIELASQLDEIKKLTASRCRDVKEYRNLIHPAAAEREKMKCSRGTAYAALAGVYGTIEDLEEKHAT